MRILMLPKWYPNRYDDQDGDFVARHVAAIVPHAEVAVLFAAVARGPLSRLTECDADLAGPVPVLRYYYRARPTGLGPLDKVLKLGLYFWCMVQGYQRLLRHWGATPQLVHAHVLLRTGLFAWWLKLTRGLPYVITEHWTLYLPQNAHRIGGLRRWLTQRVVGAAAGLHTVSENLRTALAQLGIRNPRTAIIPNVVDTTLFRLPTAAEPRRGLLHVAAFNEQAKNLSGLLRVVAHLRDSQPGVRLRIAGYGPAEAPLRQLAADLGLVQDGTVAFLGKLTTEAVAAEMRRAACFVLFSNYENLPCVLIEAQASGLPAVATAVGGVPELLPADGTCGYLVPARDEPALLQTLTQVLTQPNQFNAATLRSYAEAHFSYPAVGRQFAEFYAAVLQRP
ncbi:glycosyltransferase [Hymenobacter psychrotolerans]|uniref:Glycosyltransferase involved in cell wall bisynthesis n=1 Tax=Hymenobacter psychrotolerans DSM 18569 TaxID=1121959 RepID=A0A1M6ZB63_9BACT|nr:glycosyltransferase [Hymenobacter psychrotolerans]SHL27708.1 Glycosyltransferase involved in cell wall bisynthesis [Hymenobacter psychrotolerans DSM 18569]